MKRETRKSKTWNKLLNEGPTVASEITVGQQHRKNGVMRFNPRAGKGGALSGAGMTDTVYYIQKHDPETVIQEWLKHNPKAKKNLAKQSLHQRISRYGSGFKEASRKILGPFKSNYTNGGNGGHDGGVCPLCDEPYDDVLPNHLVDCNGEAGK